MISHLWLSVAGAFFVFFLFSFIWAVWACLNKGSNLDKSAALIAFACLAISLIIANSIPNRTEMDLINSADLSEIRLRGEQETTPRVKLLFKDGKFLGIKRTDKNLANE